MGVALGLHCICGCRWCTTYSLVGRLLPVLVRYADGTSVNETR